MERVVLVHRELDAPQPEDLGVEAPVELLVRSDQADVVQTLDEPRNTIHAMQDCSPPNKRSSKLLLSS